MQSNHCIRLQAMMIQSTVRTLSGKIYRPSVSSELKTIITLKYPRQKMNQVRVKYLYKLHTDSR